jgi:TatD DNase family protein
MAEDNPVRAVKSGAVDAHCHLFLLEAEPRRAMETATAAGVGRVVCAGVDPATSRRSLELAESVLGVFATAGVHPNEASTFDRDAGAAIEELVHNPLVVGVGETGLDYYRMGAPRDDQLRVFRIHLGLARDSGKPVVVHVRDAWEDVLRVLDEGSADRVVLHCFSGDPAIAGECERRGYYLSFAGNVTYPTNDRLRAAAAAVSLDRILVETDSPFLSPQSRRGRDNVPEFVLETVDAVARVRGEPFDDVLRATTANAEAVFPGLG